MFSNVKIVVFAPMPIASDTTAAIVNAGAFASDRNGVALLVVLDTLPPAERLFVLHDLFAIPFDESGSIMGRSPAAAKQIVVPTLCG